MLANQLYKQALFLLWLDVAQVQYVDRGAAKEL
jgi:hypothetical protein